ncbi:MAG: P-type Cu2+ transporter [Acetobacterium sp.]|jgi:Cu2+-exporting ATPase|uniref:copper-translocating P-type ATPase n=1 Tax=Acetobacterium sp. KB-1 TaxID=2184575 RepID=UPI000DBEC0B4|nr:copper-translocating P-type ATPase [Acetobacterium sp. KB-1]AWW25830.1 cadmium-translocating P-type ATPase [Acetobacterium sp. KB-1]MDK2941115.1 P-type Cu2+ transporter [Acetobacterium sp.]
MDKEDTSKNSKKDLSNEEVIRDKHKTHQEHNDHQHHQEHKAILQKTDEHVHHQGHEEMNQIHDEERVPGAEKEHLHQHVSANGGHDNHNDHHAMMVADFRKRFFISLIITVPILLLSPMIQMFLGVNWRFFGDSYLLVGLSTILFIYGGKPFLTGARDELKKKTPAMMTLIALSITVAYIYSTLTVFFISGDDFFWELATLIVIMLLGHWIEMKSVMGASKALDELVKLMPEEAHRITENGETTDISVKQLKPGDSILVKPGEKIPIDGLVYDGKSAVNEAMITGESAPVEKEKGDQIVGGSINGEGILKFKVTHVGEETFLSQVLKLVREAQDSKSNTHRLADKAAKWLFYIAVTAGILTFLAWMFIAQDLNFAVTRAVTVIVISCPHALGLAVPLVTAVSTSIGAQKGLLIRDRAAFENARKVNTVVFDKTGTLTEGTFGITDIKAIGISQEELLLLAYSVESNSEHPIAQGIVNEGKKLNLKLKAVKDYQNLTGKGLKATVDGRDIRVVSPGYMRSEAIAFDINHYEKLAQMGKTVIFVLDGDTLLGYLALSDIVRDTAREAVDTLKSMKVETILLTGDNQRVAAYVGNQLNIDTVIAEVLPQEKASKIDGLIKEGKIVAMTGDGVNDAPSLAKADLGIAIGAGTDVAIETADVILVRSNPLDVITILTLSKATYRKMIQNLIWATGYNMIALPLAAGVLYNQGIIINPAIGAALMSLSTVIVAINAKLLKID